MTSDQESASWKRHLPSRYIVLMSAKADWGMSSLINEARETAAFESCLVGRSARPWHEEAWALIATAVVVRGSAH